MRFDLKSRKRLVLSDIQYSVLRMFYSQGRDWTMPIVQWATISGNTLNSLLDAETPLLEMIRGHKLRMTTEGFTFMARYEGRDPFRDRVSTRFCQRIRMMRNFRKADQKVMLKKVQQQLENKYMQAKPRNRQAPSTAQAAAA